VKKGKIHIGTSGWHYKHWRGTYYPDDTRDADQFAIYQQDFSTVEINNSFYRLPTAKAFTEWKKSTPAQFLFAVKASRFITHMKKLKMTKQDLKLFFSRVDHLGSKLGPILFQLPPRWKLNTERFEAFLQVLPKGYRYTFEFRNETWYNEDVYALLKKYNCAFCIYELERHISPLLVTARFVYVRLHGPGNKYQGSYTTSTLKEWAKLCRKWQRAGKDAYVYFDNDQSGYAAFNAVELKKMVGK
jgi:uncharacterized protein YecE (DUF72 family)